MSRTTLVVVCAASLFAVGCRHARGSISGPAMNPKREANLMTSASARLNCPAEQLTPTFVQSLEPNLHLYQVVGCNGTYASLLHCTGVCTWREMPDARAATDLACPPEQVARAYAGSGNFTYSGCGKSTTYLHKGLSDWVAQPQPAPASP